MTHTQFAEINTSGIESLHESADGRREIKRLRRALEFYANEVRYHGPNQPPIPGDPYEPQDGSYILDVTKDYGRIAREALANES